MAGIEAMGVGRAAAIRAKGGVRPGAGFSLPEDSIKPDAIASPIALGGFLGQQDTGSDDETPTRNKAGALLSELAGLQRTLLADGDPLPVLHRLNGMLGPAQDAASPPLLALLSAVRLRARVELARRGWGQ